MKWFIKNLWVLLTTIVLLVFIFYCIFSYSLRWPFNMTRAELGAFGDSFGGVTSLFSVLAFIGVVFTYRLQNESLKKLESDSKKQESFLTTQRFESNLFQMLSLLQNIIKDMDIRGGANKEIKHAGRDVFSYYYKRYDNEYSKLPPMDYFGNDKKIKLDLMEKRISESFNTFFELRQKDLGHYFRFLYNIFKYIEESSIPDKEKTKYAKIVRAQTSNYELLLIMYNCLSKHGKNFTKYASKYMLLDNIPFEEMINQQHALLLPSSSFGAQEYLIEGIKREL